MAKVMANDELQELGFKVKNVVLKKYGKSKVVTGHCSKADTHLLPREQEKARSQLPKLNRVW